MTDGDFDDAAALADDAWLDALDPAGDPLAQALATYSEAVSVAAERRAAAMGPIDLAALQAAAGVTPPRPKRGTGAVALFSTVAAAPPAWGAIALVGGAVVGTLGLIVGLGIFLNPAPVVAPAPATVTQVARTTAQQSTSTGPTAATTAPATTAAPVPPAPPVASAPPTVALPVPTSTNIAVPRKTTTKPATVTLRTTAAPSSTQPQSTSAAPTGSASTSSAPTPQPSSAMPSGPSSPSASTTPSAPSYWMSVYRQVAHALDALNPVGRPPTDAELKSAESSLRIAQDFLNNVRRKECDPAGTCPPDVAAQLTAAQADVDAASALLAKRRAEISGTPRPSASVPSGSAMPSGSALPSAPISPSAPVSAPASSTPSAPASVLPSSPVSISASPSPAP